MCRLLPFSVEAQAVQNLFASNLLAIGLIIIIPGYIRIKIIRYFGLHPIDDVKPVFVLDNTSTINNEKTT
jgi:hypothetical protein